ncbi:glycosyltransferase 1 domain-containing protein 1 isoform X7 [Gymnodraco acuticeps]|uniref:Glycosyltransferase 1 domain-containing protein 1 isoform X7 n=1 Tax=Gymnodraco acuticeps TaxID=8218 RepID=A0A6P8UB42_GYMAC|nr:glycosyltransferase 1 domain-containing protein 1 isoform X7 [Gymnodraco acuticeps]
MKLLFLACLSPKTGNHTTAERIRSHIESAGHTCELRDAAEFQSPAEVANLISSNPTFEGALAIHLFKAGRLLLDIQVPFGVIFGGTDINEDVKVEQKRVVMEQVLQKARFAVAFTDKLKEEAELYLLSQSSRIYVQPQGIQTEVSEKFCWSEFLRSSDASIEHVDELRVFLLVCGLRRVKDPLYLVEVFSEWHYENPLNVLVIIGPKCTVCLCLFFLSNSVVRQKIDPLFTVEVEAVVKSRGLLGPGEEPTGASRCHETVLRRGKQLRLRGHVSSHFGGHGSRGTCVGQGYSRKCSRSPA